MVMAMVPLVLVAAIQRLAVLEVVAAVLVLVQLPAVLMDLPHHLVMR